MNICSILLPDGEIADGVSTLRPELRFSTFADTQSAEDLASIEFYVPPYLGGPETVEILNRLTGVQVIQLLTAGVDWIGPHVPSGVILCNARGVHEDSTSELALAGILAMTKKIPSFVRAQATSTWQHGRVGGLAGKRAVILGYGAIGRAIGRRLEAFDVEVTGITRGGGCDSRPVGETLCLLPNTDFLIVAAPMTAESRNLVDAAMLMALPNGALVVSIGRGPVIDHDALAAELRGGRLRAFLDVTEPEPLPQDSELWSLPNVLITPHIGGDSDLFPVLASRLVVAQVDRYLNGTALENMVTGSY
jgi:phosphoglycerate dehydrogenase-like enzyme